MVNISFGFGVAKLDFTLAWLKTPVTFAGELSDLEEGRKETDK